MYSELFTLNVKDLTRGLVVAVLGGVFAALSQVLNVPGFDFATFQWAEIGRIAIISAIGYLAKNLLSDESGKVLGGIG